MKYLKSFSPLVVLVVLIAFVALAGAGATFVFARSSVADTTLAKATVPQATVIMASIPVPPITALSPVGKWNLTVTFIKGSRAGKTESSVMTFLPGGIAKAEFPGSSLPSTTGVWSMVEPAAFQYHFDDHLVVNGQAIYVSTHITANLTKPNTYVAGGIGIAYLEKTHQPVGDYNVTLTDATRIS